MLSLFLILYRPLKVTVSNPAEVAKTRLQLQGELAKEGEKKVYKHSLDVFAKTWKNEGVRGMQRGLYPAVSCLVNVYLCGTFSYFLSSMRTK
jgi:solute carrier family 25 protein 34/35